MQQPNQEKEQATRVIQQICKEWADCGPLFIALGHELRQQILLALLDAQCEGMCVSKITQQTHLSRPAISHHLKILKEAGIVQSRAQGTQNYYYLSRDTSLRRLIQMSQKVEELLSQLGSLPAQGTEI